MYEYSAAVRVAARRQLKKRRDREETERLFQIRDKACKIIVAYFRCLTKWKKVFRREKIYHRRLKAARKIQKLILVFLGLCRFRRMKSDKYGKIETLRMRNLQAWAVNYIGWYWTRHRQSTTLKERFVLRKKMLDTYKALKAATEKVSSAQY